METWMTKNQFKEALAAHGVKLTDAQAKNRRLPGVKLENARFVFGMDFERANLRAANLRGATLREAHLVDADLSGADLEGADLRSADLRGAKLTNARLLGVDFKDADFRGCDLRGVNFQDANLTGALLHSVVNIDECQMTWANFGVASPFYGEHEK